MRFFQLFLSSANVCRSEIESSKEVFLNFDRLLISQSPMPYTTAGKNGVIRTKALIKVSFTNSFFYSLEKFSWRGDVVFVIFTAFVSQKCQQISIAPPPSRLLISRPKHLKRY